MSVSQQKNIDAINRKDSHKPKPDQHRRGADAKPQVLRQSSSLCGYCGYRKHANRTKCPAKGVECHTHGKTKSL